MFENIKWNVHTHNEQRDSNEGNKCFPLTFCCSGKRLDICTAFDIFSNGCGKPSFFV